MKKTACKNTGIGAATTGTGDLLNVLDKRIISSHKRGAKPRPIEKRKISRNALRLILRILAATRDGDQVWCEANEDVAKALKVHRATVIRTVKRLCQTGVLQPIHTSGGRGKPSQYVVDREKAQALIRSGYWGASKESEESTPVQKAAQKQPQEQAQEQKPAQGIPGDSYRASCRRGGWCDPCAYGPQAQDATLCSGAIGGDPWEWLSEKVKALAELFAEMIRDPLTWKLIGHSALLAGVSVVGAWSIKKVWSAKGKMQAMALALPVGFAAYNSGKLVFQELKLMHLESSIRQQKG